jgi:hypothetical protein
MTAVSNAEGTSHRFGETQAQRETAVHGGRRAVATGADEMPEARPSWSSHFWLDTRALFVVEKHPDDGTSTSPGIEALDLDLLLDPSGQQLRPNLFFQAVFSAPLGEPRCDEGCQAQPLCCPVNRADHAPHSFAVLACQPAQICEIACGCKCDLEPARTAFHVSVANAANRGLRDLVKAHGCPDEDVLQVLITVQIERQDMCAWR